MYTATEVLWLNQSDCSTSNIPPSRTFRTLGGENESLLFLFNRIARTGGTISQYIPWDKISAALSEIHCCPATRAVPMYNTPRTLAVPARAVKKVLVSVNGDLPRKILELQSLRLKWNCTPAKQSAHALLRAKARAWNPNDVATRGVFSQLQPVCSRPSFSKTSSHAL